MPTIPPPTIIRSRRKTILLQVTHDAKLVVYAPTLIPKFFIDRFIAEKKEWIEKKMLEVSKRPLAKRKTFTEGEIFLFLGQEVILTFTNEIPIRIQAGKLRVPQAVSFRIEKELETWFKTQAKDIITKRLEYHAQRMQASYTSVFFSDTKSKWGTCFPDNSLQFNWRLVMAPLLVIDYVIIHELSHTTEKNHGRDFWNRVRLFTPAYRQHREWLTRNGHRLSLK